MIKVFLTCPEMPVPSIVSAAAGVYGRTVEVLRNSTGRTVDFNKTLIYS